MVNFCCAYGCSASSEVYRNLQFHRFPDAAKDKERFLKWVNAVKRKDFKPSHNTRLCSAHFQPSDYDPPVISGPPKLKKTAIPTVFDFPEHLLPKKAPERRPIIRHIPEPQQSPQEIQETIVEVEETSHSSVGVQTTLTGIELAETLAELRREKHRLQKQINRRNQRVSNMGDLIKLLKQNALLNDSTEGILRSNFSATKNLPFELFENEIQNADKSATNRRYSDEIKQFCLTLHFYSPKAYNFIRQRSFLPDPSTIRRWVSTRECKPGILTEVLAYLQQENSKCNYLKEVALVYDAMAIRAGRFYNRKEDKFSGYCDLGGVIPEDSEEFATDALFFVIVSYTHKFKCPVAYFLITKVNASVQSQLVLAVIDSLFQAGCVVRSLTSDGASTNVSTYRKLGCTLDQDNMEPYFKHPNINKNIFCILDPVHMEKLVRNCMAETSLQSGSGNISFQFIKSLHELQIKLDFKLANRLTNQHIFYKKKKMSVKLAVQVISSRVADALQFLNSESGLEEFQGAEATIEFLRIFDRLFDHMNTRNTYGTGYKAPLSLQNYNYWAPFFEEAQKYIKSLTCDGKPIFEHRRSTFALGFLMNTVSIKGLALDLLTKEYPLKYFLAYKISQDHAELTFNCIRQRSGQNNNPHGLELSWILRKMLFRNSIAATKSGNCDGEGDINCSIFSFGTNEFVSTKCDNNAEISYKDEIQQLRNLGPMTLTSIHENALYFVAGSLVRDFLKEYPCIDCKKILIDHPSDHTYSHKRDYTSFTSIKTRGGLLFASKFAMDIILETDKLYSKTIISGNLRKNKLHAELLYNVKKRFIMSGKLQKLGHPVTDTAIGEQHEVKIVSYIASSFLFLRLYTQSKEITLNYFGEKKQLRQYLNHTVLFSHT